MSNNDLTSAQIAAINRTRAQLSARVKRRAEVEASKKALESEAAQLDADIEKLQASLARLVTPGREN